MSKEPSFAEQIEKSVQEVMEFVELDMAHSPVIPGPVSDWAMCSTECVPVPQAVVRQADGRYRIDRLAEADFQFTDEFFLKPMRARYLVLRDCYYAAIQHGALGHSMQQAVLARFFPDGVLVFQPREESRNEQ